MTEPSVVDLFKNSKPRSKLFIQMIPPGFSEEDFKELIKEYLIKIDYMVYRPGKIIRDSYGHLIGLDCPNYGFAILNFINSRYCQKFHREFHQFQLSDNFNIKSKLFIEFALMQQIPEIASDLVESKENFRNLEIFKEFLKTFPFAAKAEEDRLASIGPVAIDLEDEIFAEIRQQEDKQQVPITKISELDAKLSVSIEPTLPLPQVSFSSLLSKNNLELRSSNEAVTPLTEYIESLSLKEKILPPANKRKEREQKEKIKNEKKEKKRKETERRREEKKKRKEEDASKNTKASNTSNNTAKTDKLMNQPPEAEMKSFKTKTAGVTESLVEKQSQAPQIKGVPKILARKETKQSVVEGDNIKHSVPFPSARQPYISPSTEKIPETDLNKKSALIDDLFRNYQYPYINGKDTSSNKTEKTLNNSVKKVDNSLKQKSSENPAIHAKKQPKGKTLAERSSKAPFIRPEMASVPAESVSETVKILQKKQPTEKMGKKSETVVEAAPIKKNFKSKQSKPNSLKIEPPQQTPTPPTVNSAPIKKVFTSSAAKVRESTQIE